MFDLKIPTDAKPGQKHNELINGKVSQGSCGMVCCSRGSLTYY